MCGLCGEVRFDGLAPDLSFISRVNQQHIPRGPDGEGITRYQHVAFGHRRLKIMDTSDQSQQPMVDPAAGLSLVFNGAIYNHPELRAELQAAGHVFFSTGDTEVILRAWQEWGEAAFSRFNGMFAIALHERDSGRVILARDRLGIKPLYFHASSARLRFASTLTALASHAEEKPRISPAALNAYLNFHSIVPAEHTLFEGYQRQKPGTFTTIESNGRMHTQSFWQLTMGGSAEDAARSEGEWQELLHESLLAAVKRRNVAAVDVGVLLSGGVDSSLLTGLLAGFKSTPVKTFSVGFETVGSEVGDEFQYSDVIARHFATDHHQIRVSAERMLNALPDAITAMSEPMVSHDCVAFFLLAQEVRKHCHAVQSGQGADEVFGGYHWYPPMQSAADPFAAYRQAFFDRSHEETLQTLQSAWHAPDFAGDFVREHFQRPGAEDPVDKALRLDTTVMLTDDPVKRVDNMTMAASLEARVPFLDHELVELAARMPAELKLRDGGKYILKETARQVIPAAVIDRPKGYFPVPALKYLRGEVLEWVTASLQGQKAKERGLFSEAYVQELLQDPEAHITPLRGSKLWQLALLELWLQSHNY